MPPGSGVLFGDVCWRTPLHVVLCNAIAELVIVSLRIDPPDLYLNLFSAFCTTLLIKGKLPTKEFV